MGVYEVDVQQFLTLVLIPGQGGDTRRHIGATATLPTQRAPAEIGKRASARALVAAIVASVMLPSSNIDYPPACTVTTGSPAAVSLAWSENRYVSKANVRFDVQSVFRINHQYPL